MTSLSSDVTAALATLRTRWGTAAPRQGLESMDRSSGLAGTEPGPADQVIGSLAAVPLTVPGPAPIDEDRVVRTGFSALDAILGYGGVPRSSGLALRGDASSGKTTLALRLAAEAQAAGSIVAYVDLGRSLDPVEAVARGVRLEWLVVLEPASLDEALAMAGVLVAGRSVDLLLVDLPAERASPILADRPARSGRDGRRSPPVAVRLGRLAALARHAGVLLVVLEPPGLPSTISNAIAESAGLRLELARQAWIRLGRDVVGQWTEVVVARNRSGPPGRRAALRILYAEGGGRDACLLREPLLSTDRSSLTVDRLPTFISAIPQSRTNDRATSPSPLAAPATSPRSGARPGRPELRIVPDRAARPRRATLVERDRHRRQSGGRSARSPTGDAPGKRASPGAGGDLPRP